MVIVNFKKKMGGGKTTTTRETGPENGTNPETIWTDRNNGDWSRARGIALDRSIGLDDENHILRVRVCVWSWNGRGGMFRLNVPF